MNTISFPSLGLIFNVNNIAFSIGSKHIYWYAIIILLGFFAGGGFVYFTAQKRGLSKDNVWDIALYGLISGIICARIYYVIFAINEFTSFWDIFKIWNGGLAIYGGIIGALISTWIYCYFKKLSFLNAIDVCSPGLLIGQAIGRWGNFVNAEVYGRKTSLPWGMSINGASPVHPLFIYESLWNIIGFIIILIFRDKKKANGQVFCFYILWYSAGRLVLEGMRNTNYILYLIPGLLGISQAVAVLGIIGGILGIVILGIKNKNKQGRL